MAGDILCAIGFRQIWLCISPYFHRILRAVRRKACCARDRSYGWLKCKWGRHRCRPHSHRRVGYSSGEPSEEHLAPDVSPSNGPKDFVTGARTGIRSLLPVVSARPGRSPFVPHLPSVGSVTDHPCWHPVSSGWFSGRSLHSLHQPTAECSAFPVEKRSRSSQATKLASGLNLRHVGSQRPCGQFTPRRKFQLPLENQLVRAGFSRRFFSLPMSSDCSGRVSRSSFSSATFPLFHETPVDDGG